MISNNLTSDNILIYCAENYNNIRCVSLTEYKSDLRHVRFINTAFSKYHNKSIINTRVILNHLISFYNVFNRDDATRILFFYVDENYWDYLYSFLIFLDLMPNYVFGIDSRDINIYDLNNNDEISLQLKELK